jgi:hypothetical protein
MSADDIAQDFTGELRPVSRCDLTTLNDTQGHAAVLTLFKKTLAA